MKKQFQAKVDRFLSAKIIRITFTSILFLFVFCLYSCNTKPDEIPVLNTIEALSDNITSSSAKLQGEIKSLGNIDIKEAGIEISTTMLFTQSLTVTISLPLKTGMFEVEFTNLEPSVQYFYRAYATVNTARVYSGNVPSFKTKPSE